MYLIYRIIWKLSIQLNKIFKKIKILIILQIIKGGTKKHENTEFKGMHYVECYAIHERVVIARGRIEVPIDPYSKIHSI